MSSAYSYLANQNRKFVTTVNVPAYSTTASDWMVTLYPVPSFCKIDKITLTSSGAPSSSTVNMTVLNDGAAWGAATTALKPPFIVGTGSATMANYLASFTFTNGLTYRDASRTNCLYLNFANSSFSNGDTFTVTAEGTQLAPYNLEDVDTTPFVGDNSWRIIRKDASGEGHDLTQKLTRNGNPYGIGSEVDNSESFIAFDTASDYLYIGSVRPWTKALFVVPSYAQNATAATFAYYNGSAWVTTTSIEDNTTASMGNVNSSLSYTGTIKVTSWSGAVKTTLDFDPLTILQEDYDDFTLNIPRPGGFFYNPERYWLRIKFSTITPSDLKLVAILPVR
jgi:hypothetical protein